MMPPLSRWRAFPPRGTTASLRGGPGSLSPAKAGCAPGCVQEPGHDKFWNEEASPELLARLPRKGGNSCVAGRAWLVASGAGGFAHPNAEGIDL